MKRILIAVIAVFAITASHAQEQGKFRVGLDFGFVIVNGGGGVLFNLEPKFNIADNMNVGIRLGSSFAVRSITTDTDGDFAGLDISGSVSYMATYDYYFVLGGSFNPFVGAGIGYASLSSLSVDDDSDYDGQDTFKPDGKLGVMLRGGFEAARFRLTLEYNMIGKSTLYYTTGEHLGTVSNNYFGLGLGFYIGGGRW